jgi:hypothetical protein
MAFAALADIGGVRTSINFIAISLAAGIIPRPPRSLLAIAPMVPATIVPCPSSSLKSLLSGGITRAPHTI